MRIISKSTLVQYYSKVPQSKTALEENNIVMAQIKSEAAYRAALERIEELLPLVNDETRTIWSST